jgi:UDP-N-acetylmuramoylalanine-D-glutamate ligase
MTQPTLTAEQWNNLHPVGTSVIAYPGVRPEHPAYSALNSRRLETVTRSRAWNLGHGAPVVAVVGHSGGICLSHVDVAALEG